MKDVTAVILGGGRGSRLFPLTLERAKPAVGFAGKYRLIDIPISNCINSGIKRMFVLTQFLSASLHRHIMQTYQFDVFSNGFIDILAAEQTPKAEKWFQGTADAVRATWRHIMYYDTSFILILSGDHLYRMNYSDLLKYHQEKEADITVCVYPVPRAEAPELGLLKVDRDGFIKDFHEKPKDPKIIDRFKAPPALFKAMNLKVDPDRYLASMGIYVFDPNILSKLLADYSRTDFGRDIIPYAITKYKVLAYPFADYWKDIGTIRTFFEANISLAQPDPPFKLYYPGWPFYTRARSLPPSRIIQSEIRDSIVGDGSDITGAKIINSVIGVRSNIHEGTVLKEVVMMGADFFEGEDILTNWEAPKNHRPPLGIGRNCYIERTIIDKNARIGDGVIIRPKPNVDYEEGENFWIKDGIVVIPKGAVWMPGSKLGAMPDKD
ncbi:MAG: glucose-1-phosphate adenylyltransferase [candidate division KSB1 bacterium]|nr:glucose-1-phosphate adenylyltransferase [candidate division KSB1 bacterium]MDZ7335107.1 glucose-1-phosphate adenylyltransferase [candidate division KSB1 bacterium]MDZ7358714.1 glucose-1-phosphate adenylyltransferase [candidate division KSB1 bacterium]MDZ7398956.1 glucose-1-phosphate adenylyltransferase [candidate division KSB1 bacterium]